jgi:hypothetical protein
MRGVQPDFETSNPSPKVKHPEIIQAQGHGNESHWEVFDRVRSCHDGNNHDEEQERRRLNCVLHQSNNVQ